MQNICQAEAGLQGEVDEAVEFKTCTCVSLSLLFAPTRFFAAAAPTIHYYPLSPRTPFYKSFLKDCASVLSNFLLFITLRTNFMICFLLKVDLNVLNDSQKVQLVADMITIPAVRNTCCLDDEVST